MPNGQGEPGDWPDWTGLYNMGCTCVELNDAGVGVPKPGKSGWNGGGLDATPGNPDPDCPIHGTLEPQETAARLADVLRERSSPPKIVIDIDLARLVVDGYTDGKELTLQEWIAERAARRLIAEDRGYSEEFKRRVRAITDEEIRAAARPLIDEQFENAEIQLFGEFGPAGPPVPLKHHIAAVVKNALTAHVGSGRQKQSLLAALVQEEIERQLTKELKAAISAAKEEVVAAVRTKAGEVVADTVLRLAAGQQP